MFYVTDGNIMYLPDAARILIRCVFQHYAPVPPLPSHPQPIHLNLLVAAKAASGFLAIENMVPMSTIEKMKKKCTHSRFFEVLVEKTKKMGMRAQKKLSYNEYVRKNEIRSRIEELKKNYNANQSKVFDLERDLGRIIDNELKDRMMDLKIFDCLHAEKATSHFLNLAKKTSKGESLEKIRKPDGTDLSLKMIVRIT